MTTKKKIIKSKTYILRTCNADMTSRDGFKWPKRGVVAAPDWEPTAECGHGLHGFLMGEGDGGLASWDAAAKWLVAEVEEYIDLGGKVKFPKARVVYAGDRRGATEKIVALGATGAVIGRMVVSDQKISALGGDRSTLTGGNRSTLTGGHDSTLTGGNRSTLTWKIFDGARYRLHTIYVGEDGILPNTPYRWEGGKIKMVAGKP